MARKAAWEDLADADMGPYAKSRGTSWGRVLIALLLIGAVTFVVAYYVPMYRAHQRLTEQYRELGRRAQVLTESVSKTKQELKSTGEQRDRLQAAHDQVEAAKKVDSDRQERLRVALASKLDKLVKKGSAGVAVYDGKLLVAFDSVLLFAPRKLDVSQVGHQLLCDTVKTGEATEVKVRASLVEGSTAPAVLVKTYPGPLALNAARAVAVAQALYDECAVPATQLSAIVLANRELTPGLKTSGDHVELELGH